MGKRSECPALAAALAGLLASAAPGAAAPPPPPRFLIESVVVEGLPTPAAREIAVAETLLTAGREYDEGQLREALYRVKRLPFVLDAEMALRKGSERGAYELVLQMVANKAWFHSTAMGVVVERDDEPDGRDRVDWDAASQVGKRRFVGRWGLFHASALAFSGLDLVPVQVGYTRYNLLGRGAFASVALLSEYHPDEDVDAATLSFELGVPLSRRHSLRSTLSWRRFETSFRLPAPGEPAVEVEHRSDNQSAALAWIHDTTDDPLFATRGAKATAALEYHRSESTERGRPATSDHTYGLTLGARRFLPLSLHDTLSVEGTAAWERFDGPQRDFDDTLRFTLGVHHSLALWDVARVRHLGDLRLESAAQLHHRRVPGLLDQTELQVEVLLVHRNPWGMVRSGLVYIDALGRR
jgi:hypothetical protein